MCLLITLACTALFFVLMRLDRGNKFSVRPVFITFLSASIMWVVDGVWRTIDSEPFWDFGEGEAALGFTVAGFGILLWLVIIGFNKYLAKKALPQA